ncbi:GTP pyrophosphokinase [Companilactobacillus halodurans]|uniref:GTP pyrophosphokinase family protein n=1 Tax=Companilactobacillus halodurans TaxID=2584183 RepID=A0A5P0ZWX5_9LACO|nr:GTP pyrophosphokinase family protein [Companilactobacillus halodurans]MQS75364.1 GTP pyrophosphokinase family protein [Companilactobacillus halodurans]MQS97308.1 GTP pyrophosphokinase family protein [Companilactobacillus halodurans]
MILERPNAINLKSLQTELGDIENRPNVEELSKMIKMYQLYQAGEKEISTKLENLDSEFQVNFDYNPIHHMESRMKRIPSLLKKAQRKGYELTTESIKANIYDIAGIRVITNYIDDIYKIEKMLTSQSDITLLRRKDYLKHPKDSGYRSLHIVIKVPVFQSHGPIDVPVEVQIRTVGMDMWASLEHKLRYKTDADSKLVDKYGQQLKNYSDELENIERGMQDIHKNLI